MSQTNKQLINISWYYDTNLPVDVLPLFAALYAVIQRLHPSLNVAIEYLL